MITSERWVMRLVIATGLLISVTSIASAGWPYDSCSRSISAGGWNSYTGNGYCGTFQLGYGNNGTDRIRWYTGGCIAGRDMYITYRHGFTRRSSCDTSADHWVYVEGGYSGDAAVNQQGSGAVEHAVGAFASYNWNDWLEIGSDGGPAAGTCANMARFYPEYDAVYAGKSYESYMYAGNVYQWRYLMSNPSQAYGSWGSPIRFAHTGGVTEGPGWYSGGRVNNGPGTGPGGTMDLYFNMRPTTTGDYYEDFQMVYEGVSWMGDKVASNGNMRTWTGLSRKAPGATDGWDSGPKKKGETVRFYMAGADSWGTGNSYSWDWDGTTAQGWYAGNACSVTQEDSNDRVRINITGADPYCYSSGGLAINGDNCRYLTIRMWANGGSTSQLFWSSSAGGWSGDRHVDWNISGDSQWHVYRVALPASWSGTVYQLRLDAVGDGAANGQTVYVDWLRIHHVSDGLSANVWLGTSNNNWNIYSSTAMSWDGTNWYKDYTITGNYPSTYYCAMHMYNNNSQHCDNDADRKYGDNYREYYMANTAPTCSNSNFSGDAWTTDNTPTLTWSYSDTDSNGQSHYRVQIDDNSDFSSPGVDTSNVASASASYTSTTLGDGRWYWRVQVKDGYDFSGWSTGTSFRVDATRPTCSIGAPSVSTICAGAGNVTYGVTYADAYSGLASVNLVVGKVTLNKTGTANGTVSVQNGTTSTPTVTVSSITGTGTLGITLAGSVAQDVATNVDLGSGPATTFTVEDVPVKPTDGTPTAVSTTSITWEWSDVATETGYRVKDTGGVNKSGDLAANTVEWTESSGIATNTQYTRTIYGFNNCGESVGSNGQSRYSLQVDATPPTFSSLSTTGLRVSTTGPVNLTSGQSGVVFHDGTSDRTKVTQLYEDVSGLTANTQYTFKAKGVNGDGTATDYSDTASTWTLSAPPGSGSVTPDSASPCTATGVTWTAVGGFGAGKIQYYRYVFDQNATYTNWSDTETSWSSGTLGPLSASSAGTYYLHVKGYNGADVGNGSYNYSVTVVDPASDRTVMAQKSVVCSNTGTNIQVASSETDVSYQLKTSGGTPVGDPVSGTGVTINLPTGNLASGTTFKVEATRGACAAVTMTNQPQVAVNAESPGIQTHPSHASVAFGSASATFTVAATSNSGTPVYQWQKCTSGCSSDLNWTDLQNVGNISGATSTILTITNPTESANAGQYRCHVENGCEPACNSNTADLAIGPQPLTTGGWHSSLTHSGVTGEKTLTLDPNKTTTYALGYCGEPEHHAQCAANCPPVEARRGGMKKATIEFDYPVEAIDGTLDANDVSVLDNDNNSVDSPNLMVNFNPAGSSGTKLEINFPNGLLDQKRYTIEMRKRSGTKPDYTYTDSFRRAGGYWSANAVLPNTVYRKCQVTCLIGDVDGDREIGTNDLTCVKDKNRQSAAVGNNYLLDVNLDGNVNIIDMALVKSKLGNEAP